MLFPDVRLPKFVKLATPGIMFVNKNRANDMRLKETQDTTNATDMRFHSPYQSGA